MLKADQQEPAVLIVEHAAPIRMNIVDLAHRAGYRALEACSADEALLIIRELGDVHILFADLDIPGAMEGLKLIRTARSLCPKIRVVVVSGYGRPTDAELPVGAVFFPKPYDGARVVDALKDMLPGDGSESYAT